MFWFFSLKMVFHFCDLHQSFFPKIDSKENIIILNKNINLVFIIYVNQQSSKTHYNLKNANRHTYIIKMVLLSF